jgi:hypothetical protein
MNYLKLKIVTIIEGYHKSLFSTTLIKFFAGGIRRTVCKNNSCLLERRFCKQLQKPSGCIGRYFDTNDYLVAKLYLSTLLSLVDIGAVFCAEISGS